MKLFLTSALVLFAFAATAAELVPAKLQGTVTDAEGKPVAGAKIMINKYGDAALDRSQPFEAVSDDQGHYALALKFPQDQTLRIVEIFVDCTGYVRTAPELDLSVKARATVEQNFQLEPGKILGGVLKLPLSSSEIAGRQKVAELRRAFLVSGPKLGPRPYNSQFYYSEPGGRFAIYLPEGEYTIEVGPQTAYDDKGRQWTNLPPGQDNLVLEISEFGWTEKEVLAEFDAFWDAFDRHYSYFILKKDVDWKQLGEEFRPQAAAAKNARELANVLQKMLAPLRDLHVWINLPAGRLGTFASGYRYNGNRDVVLASLTDRQDFDFASVGKTMPDGFGYFLMQRQSKATEENVEKSKQAIRALGDAPGFIVDLRQANGGSEPLALEIAILFCAQETTYAKNKNRDGTPDHAAFRNEYERKLPAGENPYTRPMVCLIGPGAVSSGEGFVKMMKALPQVTTVGMPTRGASGNPKPHSLGRTGVIVFYSSWVDMLPDGQTFEGVGIPPGVRVEADDNSYKDADPTFERGIEILRKEVAKAK